MLGKRATSRPLGRGDKWTMIFQGRGGQGQTKTPRDLSRGDDVGPFGIAYPPMLGQQRT